MKLYRLLLVGSLLAPSCAAFAQGNLSAGQWLQRIYSATQHLSYTGTFVYRYGDRMETSRVTSLADANGPVEKLEILDGVPREIIRSPNKVVCYLPSILTVKIDTQGGRHPFPALLSDRIRDIKRSYVVRKGGVERIAGYNCQELALDPRDDLRYHQRLCADLKTGMLLKSETLNKKNKVLESFAFTQIDIGAHIKRADLKSEFVNKAKDWHVEVSGATETNLARKGWTVKSPLPGFRKITEVTRTLNGTSGVGHVVFSDGLAAISVFIEPKVARNAKRRPGFSRQGAINVYVRALDGYWVTAVGEAPARSVEMIADAVKHRARNH